MAIKPENKKLYPKNWKKFSKYFIRKKGNRCERCKRKKGKIWLTIHHKDRNPTNNNDENLIVLCPKCHFKCEYLINIGIYNNKRQLKFIF